MTESFELRELRIPDATRCAELEAILFPGDNPWPRDVFVVEFSHPTTFYTGVFDEAAAMESGGHVLVAYAGLAMMGPAEDPEFEIHTIGVDPDYQRRGLGRVLMEHMMHIVDSCDGPVFLEVRTDNTSAIAMYEAFGFHTLAIRKNYYRPSGADAYTMCRPRMSDRRSEKPADGTTL